MRFRLMDCTLPTVRGKDELKQAAHYYAGEFGLPVFPLQAGGKVPCKGSHAYKDATTDAEQIEAWWTQSPDANIAIPTGKVSGLYVVDGLDGVTEIEGFPPRTVNTPLGGHWYFHWRPGLPTIIRVEGVDCVRSDGFYVAVPPSVRADGKYEWIEPFSYSALPEFPLSTRISEAHTNNGTLTPGSRHVALKDLAVKLRRDDYMPDEIHSILLHHNDEYCTPPKPEDEVRKIAEWTGTMEGEKNDPSTIFDFNPIPASQFPDEPEPEYIWDQFIATRSITMLSGVWKGGKTTMLLHVLNAMAEGGKIHTPVKPGRVLYISEESRGQWKLRFEKEGIMPGNHVDFVNRPFKRQKPTLMLWQNFIGAMIEATKQQRYDLVILDTISRLGSARDPDSAPDVVDELAPLEELVDVGPGVLVVHHPRKGGSPVGEGFRGSGQYGAGVDTMIELRLFSTLTDPRRKINVIGRQDIEDVILERTPEGYVSRGTAVEAQAAALRAVIDTILSDKGQTFDEITEQWPTSGPEIADRTLRRLLNSLAERSEIRKTGTGKRNDACRFWKA